MSLQRLKEMFLRLPLSTKCIGIGSAVLAISTFFPWYADLDRYNVGEQFLGVTGPTSLMGILIFLFSGFSFWLFSHRLRDHHAPRLPVKESILHITLSAQCLLLLVLVNSVYFHPKFGVNITAKEPRFGMTIAIISAIAMFIGAYLNFRREKESDISEGKLEPLIKLEKTEGADAPAVVPPPAPRPHISLNPHRTGAFNPKDRTPRGFLFGERPAPTKPQEAAKEQEPKEQPQSGGGSFKIRMDL